MENLKLTKLDKIKMINAKIGYEFIDGNLEYFYSDKDVDNTYLDVVVKGKRPIYVEDTCYLLYPIAKYTI